MDRINFDLPFRDLKKGENLYDGDDLQKRSIVQAEYIKREGYEDNADVCAIPKCPTKMEIIMMTSIGMPAYNYENISGMELYEIKEQIADMQYVINPLGVHFDLAYTINKKLLESYKSRETRISHLPHDNNILNTKSRILSLKKQASGRTGGFLMTGVTGCGKTVALSVICSMYPEAIRHSFPDYEYIQIPIIRITALVGNLSDLYTGIAARLDQILDTGDFHVKQVRNKSLAYVGGVLKDWIEQYHIGLLIIDEVQFLDFGSGRTSFENIIGITERTGMAFGLVGNNETMDVIDRLPRIFSRVLSNHIVADQLANTDKAFFVEAVKELWEYQWTTEYVQMTREIMEAIIMETSYNIALLKALLVTIQMQLVTAKEPVNVDINWIHHIAGPDFQHLRKLIATHSVESDREFAQKLDETFGKVKAEAQEELNRYKSAALEDIKMNERKKVIERKITQAVEAIIYSEDYTSSQAKRAVKKVLKEDPTLTEVSVREIVRAAKLILKEGGPKDKKRKQTIPAATCVPEEIQKAIRFKVEEVLESGVTA